MKFLLSVIDDGQAAAAGRSDSATEEEASAIDAFNDGLRENGHWVLAGGLGGRDEAVTIDNRRKIGRYTDGPFAESKEFVAGFWIIEADSVGVARGLAAVASDACNRRVELRPIR